MEEGAEFVTHNVIGKAKEAQSVFMVYVGVPRSLAR